MAIGPPRMASTAPRLRVPHAWRERGTAALLIALVLAVEVVVAAGIVIPRLTPLLVLGLLGAAGLVLLQKPMWGAALAVVVMATVIPRNIVRVPVGPVELRAYELVVAALVAAALVTPRARTWGGLAGGALAVFLCLVGFASGLAIFAGRTSFGDAFAWSRVFGVLLLFFALIRLFPDRRSLDRLLVIGSVAGAATGVFALAVAAGVDLSVLVGSGAADFVTQPQDGSTPRIRLPGVALAYTLLWFAVLRMLRSRGGTRAGWTAIVLGMTVNIALSFNRNMWVGLILGLGLLVLLGGPTLRRSVALGAAVFTAAICAAVLIGVGPEENSPVQPIVQRGQTLLDPRAVAQTSSLQDRFGENRYAWQAIAEHPFTGIGAGVHFGVYYGEEVAPGRYERAQQLFLHNQYLYLLLIGGVPTLLAFAVFLGTSLHGAFSRVRDLEMLALGVALAMILLSAAVTMTFGAPDMLCALSIVTAVIYTRTRPSASTAA